MVAFIKKCTVFRVVILLLLEILWYIYSCNFVVITNFTVFTVVVITNFKFFTVVILLLLQILPFSQL